MFPAATFCRLVLGDAEAGAGAAAAAAGVDDVDALAAAWLACLPELERRRTALTWGTTEPEGPPGLAELGDEERAAVVAQALGSTSAEIEQALGREPGGGPALLSRAHARLAAAAPPLAPACSVERERVAGAPRPTASRHCGDCRAFAATVRTQRRALVEAVGGGRGAPGPGAAARLAAALEPAGRGPRAGVAVAVLALSTLAGYGVVSALETPSRAGRDGVVTATPVGPLPPGVGPDAP